MPDFIKMTGISKHFGGIVALADVDFDIAAGEVHCLAGENGCGKSTLIKIISGVQPPDQGGSIIIDGIAYSHLTPAESTRIGIQVIYQDLSLFPDLTVAENIAFAQHLRGLHGTGKHHLYKRAKEVTTRLGISLKEDALVGDLSIAQRQLVAICRALAADARLVIMDEPTASLTRAEVDALLAIVRELKRRGIAVVFVSHRLDEVLEVSERVTVLRDGRKAGTWTTEGMTPRRLGELMTGHEYDYEVKLPDLSTAPTVLSVRGLSRAGDFSDINIDIKRGEILGIIGLLGSGRTELALSLFGMHPADKGEILLDGKAVRFTSNRQAIDQGIAYVSEDRLTLGLVQEQPISKNIVLPTLDRLKGRGGLLNRRRVRDMVQRWITQLGIKVSNPDNPVRTLSGGNQQRVVLSKWLATEPRVLILDSPTVGVDINAKDGIYAIVKRLAAEGMAVMMISDEVPEVLYHSHRIVVMQGGRVKGEYSPTALCETSLREIIDA